MSSGLWLCQRSELFNLPWQQFATSRGEWLYLADDCAGAAELRRRLPGWREIEYRDELAETAASAKRPYIDLIATIGRRQPPAAWIASSIAHKNLGDPVFLDFCRMKNKPH